ncbi:MAG: flagellar hook-length control protein FliK [Rhodocyclaceae bacterium]|nr:flagellar hook-length control protein FliK [Rhodocyclaceae bacterium]
MQPAAGKAATLAAANKDSALKADAPTEAPADAASVLASMLANIAAAQPASAKSDAAAADARDPAQGGNGLDAATITAMAASVAISGNPATAATAKAAAATPDARTRMSATAIVAAEPAANTEGSADIGKPRAQADNFAAALDAARATQTASRDRAVATAGDNAAMTANTNAAASIDAAASAAATAAHPVTRTAAPNASATIATPVGTQGWDREVGDKLTWMVGRQETHAELVLNPPQLGRIEVSLSMNGDQANATFTSANPLVRDALQNAMPHLREMLQDAGISLGQTQVGAESFRQSADTHENGDNSRRGHAGNGDGGGSALPGIAASSASQTQWLQRGNGLVDTFA